MMDYKEFRDSVKKVSQTRNHKVKNSWGVYDAYKYIRKNKWFNIGRPVTEKEFYSIIRTINKRLAEYLIQGYEIKLPYKLGSLELRKRPTRVAIVDGKLVNNFPIDWDATLKLWFEDEQSYKDKTIIKTEDREVYRVYYDKNKAQYNNKSFYQFQTNRDIKKKIVSYAKRGLIQAFNMQSYD